MAKSTAPPKAKTPEKQVSEILQREPVDRSGDELMQLPEIVKLTTLSEPTLRYLRHKGEGPPMFKLHRRLVAWRSECVAWIEEQAAKEAAGRSA